ncbi:MAG: transcription-repair coupling factor [Bacteroidales bacterium]|nr:transcription-repair coupling factor [Bacteroidales bacterium]
MELTELQSIYSKNNKIKQVCKELTSFEEKILHLKNLLGSSASFIASACIKNVNKPFFFILSDKEEASYFYNDLTSILGQKQIHLLLSSYYRSIKYKQTENSNIVIRTEVLNHITNSSFHRNNHIIISYPEAIIEKVPSKNDYKKNVFNIKVGDKISIDTIIDYFDKFDFQRTDFVYEPGQYSVRGSITDVFSYSNKNPYRIDFFGDEIDSIRSFNIENQLSIKKLTQISIVPNIQKIDNKNQKITIFDFILPDTILWFKDIQFTIDKINSLYESLCNNSFYENNGNNKIFLQHEAITGEILLEKISNFKVVEFGNRYFFKTNNIYNYNTSLQPSFNKNFDLLADKLINNSSKGYKNLILSDNEKQIERIKAIFCDKNTNVEFKAVSTTIHEGFIDHETGICFYTDHQIFNRYHKFKVLSRPGKSAAISLQEINNLNPGDYVVHIDHGIGKFGGLEKIEINGKYQETIRLIFKDNDILYVSIHSLHRISKYKGKDGISPKIYKLGSKSWQNLKQNTKKKIKDIAKELITLYAKRKTQEGYEFSPDSYLNQELEASFIYEDTPDQIKANQSVKTDMESSNPMDRLICGDVGFGKTEIAIRAAFKAVADSKQVAVLVPTTILALQHYNTFKERLKNFPCTIEYINRFKKTSTQKEIIKNLSESKIDILIGTHRLISKDIKFKDLGLMIIDEEQKFGVSIKEKLKQLKLNVDTLTLTATPIPRTLQFSLMGARDLSIINTAPPNRHPIYTELHTFNEEIIKEAIYYEVARNGQVFFINNRIQNIEEIADIIRRLCPEIKIVIAHGQMEGKKLEKIMLEFINGDHDVLVATSIIESGLDIPNANTIIINNAHYFGLSDLHQLRGRVGRSNKKAFCYLIAPPLTILTPEARRRLKAIEDFSELGSGFNIALQDLDIRGAGNILGAEQSGFIADIGFDTYHKILNETILELKETEFKDLYRSGEKTDNIFLNNTYISDCHIDTDMELLFPDDYISNISERIKLYRELDNIQNEEHLEKFKTKLIDRFGNIPQKSLELLNVVKLRWLAISLGIEKIILKNNKLIVYFVSNQNSLFYQSEIFRKILVYIQSKTSKFKMQEKKEKLSLTIENIKKIEDAISTLQKFK